MTQFNPTVEFEQLKGEYIALGARIAEIERQVDVDLVAVIALVEPDRLSAEDYASARAALREYRNLSRAIEDMRQTETRMLYWIERSAMYCDNPAMAAMIEVAKAVPVVRKRVIEITLGAKK